MYEWIERNLYDPFIRFDENSKVSLLIIELKESFIDQSNYKKLIDIHHHLWKMH